MSFNLKIVKKDGRRVLVEKRMLVRNMFFKDPANIGLRIGKRKSFKVSLEGERSLCCGNCKVGRQ